jgi:hypothetical protein
MRRNRSHKERLKQSLRLKRNRSTNLTKKRSTARPNRPKNRKR